MIKVLFVCMGNICRSPTAEGVFTQQVATAGLSAQIQIDSAGTHAYHIGNPPDSRSQHTAQQRGIDISHLRARQVTPSDFTEFDYILAMDEFNHSLLIEQCPQTLQAKVQLLMDFAAEANTREVPDPYYGGAQGFEQVFDLVEMAGQGLLTRLRQHILSENGN